MAYWVKYKTYPDMVGSHEVNLITDHNGHMPFPYMAVYVCVAIRLCRCFDLWTTTWELWFQIIGNCTVVWSIFFWLAPKKHYDDVIIGAIVFQITSLTIVYSTVYSRADQSKHQSSASLAFVWGIHRGPVNSPHKWPVTRKMFPFDEVIMKYQCSGYWPIVRGSHVGPVTRKACVYYDVIMLDFRICMG